VTSHAAGGGVRAAKAFDAPAFLRERGVPEEEISAAKAQGTLPLLVIDQLLFPGQPRYDDATLLDKVGVDREYARALWRAMGFPAVPEGEVAFYDDDLEALRSAAVGDPMRQLLPDLVHETRVMSAAMARIAEQSTDDVDRVLRELRQQGLPEEEVVERFVSIFRVEQFQELLWYMFRRQFRAAAWRKLADPGPGTTSTPTAVGFVDLVRFAAVTENVADDELERLIVRFEEVAYDAIAEGGGRVVKTIGDAVMFVADDPERATLVAIDLVDAYARDDLLPPARAGLALGAVLARDGDYFGPPVNLAARIVDVARPSRVVVSDELRDALAPSGRFSFRRLPPKRLRGMGHPPLWAAARASG
jgi:adenylate cyclase